MDLATLLTCHEGKTLEFKRDGSSHATILRTVVAFANTAGGVLVVGVDDDRAVRGLRDPLATEERLASLISDGVAPRLVPEIEIVAWRDTAVVVVEVHPGPCRPYHVRSVGPESGTHVRVGSTNRVADAALASEIARSVGGRAFDEEALPDLGQDAIDMAAARDAFAGVRKVGTRELTSLGVLAQTGGRLHPTAGGLILFGRDRLSLFPDAWIQAGRFRGVDKRIIADSLDITAPPIEAIEHALAFLRRSIVVGMDVSGSRRTDVWQYPMEALREAVVNSVVHADYAQAGAPIRIAVFDDRIEIENPGLLVPGLTVPDILQGVSKLRNRVIGRVFREIGLIEQWGSGVMRIVAACRAAGLPDPRFDEVGTRFRVTVRADRTGEPAVGGLDAVVLAELGAEHGLSTAQVAERIGRTTRSARERLKRLVDAGLVVEVGSAANDPHRRYFVAEDPGGYKPH